MAGKHRHRSRWTAPAGALAALGVCAGLFGSLPVVARAETKGNVVSRECLERLWARSVRLSVEGESVRELLSQMAQQRVGRFTYEDVVVEEPLSAFATGCTLGDVRNGLADLFQFHVSPYLSAESIHFRVWESPTSRPAAVIRVAETQKPRPAPQASRKRPASPRPAAPGADAELLEKIVIPADMAPIRERDLYLPAIQRRLAKLTGIRILSDYADRTEDSLGEESAEAFFRSLNGKTLREALDTIAARFDYTWRKSRGWYLFRSRHWKAEREERLTEADEVEEAEEELEAAPAERFRP
jgi:hypothetical protein